MGPIEIILLGLGTISVYHGFLCLLEIFYRAALSDFILRTLYQCRQRVVPFDYVYEELVKDHLGRSTDRLRAVLYHLAAIGDITVDFKSRNMMLTNQGHKKIHKQVKGRL